MRVLDRKLLRDLLRLWAQALAIALVIAGGVATFVMAVGSYQSLQETRTAYYERYRFADVFATVRRAPGTVAGRIARIPGVGAVETRIEKLALLDIDGFREPATGRFISLPENGTPRLNVPYLRSGRMPDPDHPEEVVINESFASAHDFSPGSVFRAILNGRKRSLKVVGTALSPEFVYAIGPGDIMPDGRRYGVIWMPEKALASIYDLKGAFSSVSLILTRGASEPDVIKRLDDILRPYGGEAAYSRKDQISDAYLNHALDMLRNMSRTLPPIFLAIAIFLVNLTLSRLVALEREQIGLLKAVGFANGAIAAHYLKFVLAITVAGIAIGSLAGTWLGIYVTGIYADYFRFPILVFSQGPDLYIAAALLSILAAGAGAARSIGQITGLAPAVAMHPPAPPHFRRMMPRALHLPKMISPMMMMTVRNTMHHPLRTALTTLGMALSTGILVVSLFMNDSMEKLIDVKYFRADRQDATVSFVQPRRQEIRFEMMRLPGVLSAEPFRRVPARIGHGSIERRVMIRGLARDSDLNRIIDSRQQSVQPPEIGVAISRWLAQELKIDVGDYVDVDFLEGRRRKVRLPVTALVEDYFGINATMSTKNLADRMLETPLVDNVNLSLDGSKIGVLFDALKKMPAVSGISLQTVSLANFRDAIVVIVTTMAGIYTGLASVIAFGIVYNSARISLSERGRELASLRILGFTRAEVIRVLLMELGILTILAQPLGWAAGYGLAWVTQKSMNAELMRMPLVVERPTYAIASAIVIVAAIISSLLIRRRVRNLDLVSVMKTRE